jgi:hypothetical protein
MKKSPRDAGRPVSGLVRPLDTWARYCLRVQRSAGDGVQIVPRSSARDGSVIVSLEHQAALELAGELRDAGNLRVTVWPWTGARA